jgi:DNA-binding MarR family transcriptional regulator
MAANSLPPSFPDGVETLVSLLKVATRIAGPMRDAVADPEGVSVTELRILLALGGEGELAGHDLAELMAMQPMNVSRALVTLVDMGLIEAVDNADNRRRKPYRLTAAGAAKFANVLDDMRAVADFVFGALSPKEREQGAVLLSKLDARLQDWVSPEDRKHVKRP